MDSLFESIQPYPQTLAEVVDKIERFLLEVGFTKGAAAPSSAMYKLEHFADGAPDGTMVLLCCSYVQKEKAPRPG